MASTEGTTAAPTSTTLGSEVSGVIPDQAETGAEEQSTVCNHYEA
jgi:hypothetical protein